MTCTNSTSMHLHLHHVGLCGFSSKPVQHLDEVRYQSVHLMRLQKVFGLVPCFAQLCCSLTHWHVLYTNHGLPLADCRPVMRGVSAATISNIIKALETKIEEEEVLL